MQSGVQFIAAIVLFLIGLRLSAFFSGSETGFYRASFLRLTIDAHAGDRLAKRLLWFAHRPSYFVATTLVGNNVANYITTFAIGLALSAWITEHAAAWEILGTLLFTPLIFIFGELLPKYLYYRAPLMLLRRDGRWFSLFAYLFLPVSLPLVGLTKLLERLLKSPQQPMRLMLGRQRLGQVAGAAHQEGILTGSQGQLINGVLTVAPQSVADSLTPASRVLGVPDTSTAEEVIAFAGQYGVNTIAIRKPNEVHSWYGYVRLIDVVASGKPLAAVVQKMPRLPYTASKLEAFFTFHNEGVTHAAVYRDEELLGVINERGIVEQLFRNQPLFGSGS